MPRDPAADQRGPAGRRVQPDAGRQRGAPHGDRLESRARRPGSRRGQGCCALRRRADGPLRREEKENGGRRPPTARQARPGTAPARARSGDRRAVRAVAAQTGLAEDLRKLARRTVVNVLPKAIGVKLVERPSRAGRTTSSRPSTWSSSSTRRRSCRTSGSPSWPHADRQPARDRDRDLGTGRGQPGREMTANHPLDASGRIKDLESFPCRQDRPSIWRSTSTRRGPSTSRR